MWVISLSKLWDVLGCTHLPGARDFGGCQPHACFLLWSLCLAASSREALPGWTSGSSLPGGQCDGGRSMAGQVRPGAAFQLHSTEQDQDKPGLLLKLELPPLLPPLLLPGIICPRIPASCSASRETGPRKGHVMNGRHWAGPEHLLGARSHHHCPQLLAQQFTRLFF